MWGCTLREAKQRISSTEFSEWMAWYSIEPWGDQRADLRMAISTAEILNCWRAKGSKPIKPEQIMPFPLDGKKAGTIEGSKGMMSALRGFAKAFGKVISPKPKQERQGSCVASGELFVSPAGVRKEDDDGHNGKRCAGDTGNGDG